MVCFYSLNKAREACKEQIRLVARKDTALAIPRKGKRPSDAIDAYVEDITGRFWEGGFTRPTAKGWRGLRSPGETMMGRRARKRSP